MFERYDSGNVPVRRRQLKRARSKISKTRRELAAKTEREPDERPPHLFMAEVRILKAHRKIKGVGGILDLLS
jgi:hypothetical protein